MVAGGAQKVHALSMLVSGRCPEAPIDISKLVDVIRAILNDRPRRAPSQI